MTATSIGLVEALQLIILVATGFGLVWRVAQVEKAISDRVKDVKSDLNIHITDYKGKVEMHDYRIHSLDQKIDHKFGRLHGNQKDVMAFLEKKSGFVPRDNYNLPDSSNE